MAQPAAIFLALLLLAAAGSAAAAGKVRQKHWYTPWRKPPAAAPAPVHELLITNRADGSAAIAAQYWYRNNLRVDLTGVAGTGALQLRPVEGGSWPVRLEFAVRPGSMAQLEVRGDKRVVFNLAAGSQADGAPQILELGSGTYTLQTAALSLDWR